KCAKPEWPGSYSSREPVRTIDQNVASPWLGIGITITLRPLSSFFVVVWKGMMPFTSWASWESAGAPGINVAQSAQSAQTSSNVSLVMGAGGLTVGLT